MREFEIKLYEPRGTVAEEHPDKRTEQCCEHYRGR